MKHKILATVVTYNRLHLLKNCLKAVRAQSYLPTDILIVDNCSTDGTEKFVRENYPEILYLKLAENTGSGGGQHNAFKFAYENGYDYIWTMDDDGVPDENCLEKLIMNDIAKESALVNSLVVDIENPDKLAFGIYDGDLLIKTVYAVKTMTIKGWCSPFNSTLAHRNVMARIGFPNKKLFIWGDEQEYLFRAKKHGIDLYIVADSIIRHPGSFNRLNMEIPLEGFWKIYFLIRNMLSYQKNKYNCITAYCVNFICFILYAYQILNSQKDNRPEKAKIMLFAYFHGITNNLDLTIDEVKRLLK
ncbi:glycosyltransferase family 2 protein [Patescibacteria group bacterium]|nr:glycosyltransferase family 2 protein [Patescibacteria group bacterium]